MTQFEWLSLFDSPPARWDLRYLGWVLVNPEVEDCDASAADRQSIVGSHRPILVDWRDAGRSDAWRTLPDKRWAMAIGVEDSGDRAALLREGIGDALPMNVALVEVATRALRLGDHAQALRRFRSAGPVVLDLFHRDGRIEQQWLGLHPREFGLLWRLADQPGQKVTRKELLADVWRLDHDPETNSVEVHISRLRSKLKISHASWLIVTDPEGGYRLSPDGSADPIGGDAAQQALDSAKPIGNDTHNDEDGDGDAVATQREGIDRTGG